VEQAALRAYLRAKLAEIEAALQTSALSGPSAGPLPDDGTDDGIVARIGRAVDAYSRRRAQDAEEWRRKNIPGYKPDTDSPPVPSEVVRKTLPKLSDAIDKAKGLPDLGRAAAQDLTKFGWKLALSAATEFLPWALLIWCLHSQWRN